MTENETKKLIEENDKIQHIKNLESIAKWKPNAYVIFHVWSISSFADEHFGHNCIDIKQKYRELAKVHHPDKGGNELMFKLFPK